MKHNLVFLTLFLIIMSSILATHMKSKMKMKMKMMSKMKLRAKKAGLSLMEYMDNYRRNRKMERRDSTIQESREDHSNSYKEDKLKELEKKKQSAEELRDQQILVKDLGSMDMVKQGWLSVGTPRMRDLDVYPNLNHPDASPDNIHTDRNYFRKNRTWQEGQAPSIDNPPSQFSMWCRLTLMNFYYTYGENSIHALANIPIKMMAKVVEVEEVDTDSNCFDIYKKDGTRWRMCSKDAGDRLKWVCKFRMLLSDPTYHTTCKDEDKPYIAPTILERKVDLPIIMVPQAAPFCNVDWNYNSNGKDWECECSEGKEQSPINLPKYEETIWSPVRPVFNYVEVQHQTVENTDDGQVKTTHHLDMVNEKHALRLNHDEGFGKVITLDGAVYKAQEIIFHTPAQHTVDGKHYDMEIEIVHYGQTAGDIAKQVVVSFLFQKSAGAKNMFLDDMDFFTLPGPIGTRTKHMDSNVYIPKILYQNNDAEDVIIMKDFSFYTYQGSLTAPPCTQRTIHYVKAQPMPIGTVPLELFKEALRIPDMMDAKGNVIVSDVLPINNRALQDLHGRSVFYYKAEKSENYRRGKQHHHDGGHYERIDQKTNEFFYVSNNRPSGMPGALVVSKMEATGKEDEALD